MLEAKVYVDSILCTGALNPMRVMHESNYQQIYGTTLLYNLCVV